MSLLKFLFVSTAVGTAVGTVAVTAPVVFIAGRMFGKIEERHQSSKESTEEASTVRFKHEVESSPWSDADRNHDTDKAPVEEEQQETKETAEKPKSD